ncbi:hypothetical protein FKM82_008210 [Ascaphus truei]
MFTQLQHNVAIDWKEGLIHFSNTKVKLVTTADPFCLCALCSIDIIYLLASAETCNVLQAPPALQRFNAPLTLFSMCLVFVQPSILKSMFG